MNEKNNLRQYRWVFVLPLVVIGLLLVGIWQATRGPGLPAITWPTGTPGAGRGVPLDTAIPSSTPTAAWTELACPTLGVTVDGSLAEWAAATPYALNTTSASYAVVAGPLSTRTPTRTVEPLTTPGMWTVTPAPVGTITITVTPTPTTPPTPTPWATVAGWFYCAHDAAQIYFAGIITDSLVFTPTGSLANGDAVRIAVDGLGDDLFKFRQDDHDLYIGYNGRVRDFVTYPISMAVSISTTAAGWLFESAVLGADLGVRIGPGGVMGLLFGYHDNRGGATWARLLMGAERTGRLQ